MKQACKGILLSTVLLLSTPIASADEAKELKMDAISRAVHSHEPDVPQAIARIYIKQSVLTKVQEAMAAYGREHKLGRDWNATAPEWRAAETQVIAAVEAQLNRRIDDPQWFFDVLTNAAMPMLKAEDADEVATHFATEGGQLQVRLIDYKVLGELVMTSYSFTNRIQYNVPATEADMLHLQDLWFAQEPFKKRDFSGYPNVMKFAGGATGLKYMKMLVTQGVPSITGYIDQVAREVAREASLGDEQIAMFAAQYRSRIAQ
jgi:hypothetical protein